MCPKPEFIFALLLNVIDEPTTVLEVVYVEVLEDSVNILKDDVLAIFAATAEALSSTLPQ